MSIDDDDPDAQRAGTTGARRAMACISHELTGPLMALQTHLKLARRRHDDPSLDAALRCLDRLREITTTLQLSGHVDGAEPIDATIWDLATITASLGLTLHTTVTSPARVFRTPATLIISSALRAVARTAADSATLHVHIAHNQLTIGDRLMGPDSADSHTNSAALRWRPLDPLQSARSGLDLWLAALAAADAGGSVQISDTDGVLAVLVELPEAA